MAMEDGKASIGDKFTNFLKAGKTLPGKILLNLKDDPDGSPSRAPISFNKHAQNPSQTTEGGSAHESGSPFQQMNHHDSNTGTSTIERGGSVLVSTFKEATSTVKEAFSGLRLGVRSSRPDVSGNSNNDEGEGRGGSASDAIPSTSGNRVGSGGPTYVPKHRMDRFTKLLDATVVDMDTLREVAWNGIPYTLRPTCWKLLLGYLPPARARQASTLARKRAEYNEMVPQYYDIPASERAEEEQAALRQVIVDVPRTAPNVPFFHEKPIQQSLERLLYIWGIRHPASGYVQGMNDLVTPFLAIFLSEHLPGPIDSWQPEQLTEAMMLDVEADCYWCLCKLVEGIQDHYTYAQPGIQRAVFKIQELVGHYDKKLSVRLAEENLDFIQFAWRWVNCLLIRELPFHLSFRLWDTYLAESNRIDEFLIYVCGSFLVHWSKELLNMEFQDMIMFLQRVPTSDWDEPVLEMVLSRAFMWISNTTSEHLKAQGVSVATRELERFKGT